MRTAAAVCMAGLCAGRAWAALPEPESVTASIEQVRQVFANDYRDSSIEARAALADRLLDLAETSGERPAEQYALLSESIRLSVMAGAVQTTLDALESVELWFDVDVQTRRNELLDDLARTVDNPRGIERLVGEMTRSAQRSLRDGDLTATDAMVRQAERLTRRIEDLTRRTLAEDRLARLSEYSREAKRIDRYRRTLVNVPDQEQANTMVGLYDLLVGGDTTAAARLIHSSDPTVLDIARDLRGEATLTDAQRGEAWATLAKRHEYGPIIKRQAARRALSLLSVQVQQAGGLQAMVMQQRLTELGAAAGLPAGYDRLSDDQRQRLLYVGKKVLLACDDQLSWDDAQRWCTDMGGHLVSLANEKDHAITLWLMRRDFGNGVERFWVGGTDRQTEGRWEWIDGTDFRFTHWADGQPSKQSDKEDYLYINANGQWAVGMSFYGSPFVAQWDVD